MRWICKVGATVLSTVLDPVSVTPLVTLEKEQTKMDPTPFDPLANALTIPVSRRKALQALAAVAGASVLGSANGDIMAALARTADGGGGGGGTKLTGKLVFPSSPDYDSARLGFARQFSQFPLVIVFCQNVQDVVNALRWCQENNVPFRARSGRHSLEGWSALDNGVVIDVSNMKQTHIDTQAGVAIVQTGADQGEIVDALGQAGYAMPSGGEPRVGIAGVTLGGGIGLLSRSMGLACDHLLSAEMVVPSGKQDAEVIRVDEQNNADLLWASRGGGGNNFGIATSFTFKIQPMFTVAMYEARWDWQYVSELFQVWQNVAPFADERFGSIFNPYSQVGGRVESSGLFIGSENELRDLLQPLFRIGKPNITIKTLPYLDAFHYFSRIPEAPENDKISSAWAYRPFPSEAIQSVSRFLAEATDPGANVWCLNWGGAVGRIPPDATAFFHRKAQFYLEWESTWKLASEEERNLEWVERFREALQPYVIGSYVNVPDRNIVDWPDAYYGSNVARLRMVKSKYDPQNVFHFEQSIPPA